MATAIDALTEAVKNETTVEASAATLLGTLSADLKAAAAAGDMSAVQTLADTITANASTLAAAITANTPAAPAGSGATGATGSTGATTGATGATGA